jgi:hypothetical protein
MIKEMLDREINKESLKNVAKLLHDLDYMVFFGTALGIHRDGDVLLKDDDIDILASSSDYLDIKSRLLSNGYDLPIDADNTFSQYTNQISGKTSLVDFYFYEDYDENHVIEKWNFSGQHLNPNNHLVIPKSILFDIKTIDYFGTKLKIPNDLESVCIWLYGQRYREPLRKNIDYMVGVENNKPKIVYR